MFFEDEAGTGEPGDEDADGARVLDGVNDIVVPGEDEMEGFEQDEDIEGGFKEGGADGYFPGEE